MQLPASTGEVAQFLGVPEPRLNDLIRRGRIVPLPPIAAGRRRWEGEHIIAAASAAGLDESLIRDRFQAREVSRV
jgi:hypothetical protein